MAKIKVIQISVAVSIDDTWDLQYLDDKGRVWERFCRDGKNVFEQLELPEEPAQPQQPKEKGEV